MASTSTMSDVTQPSTSAVGTVAGSIAEHPSAVWTIGADGSECAQHAAMWAVAHAPERVGTIRVAAAWSIPMMPAGAMIAAGSPAWDASAIRSAAEQQATGTADQIRTALEDGPSTITVDALAVEGAASSALINVADGSDLLVLGSRGLGGFSRLVLGSTSTQCATHSPVAIAIIPRDAPIPSAEHIVVAFDGSPNSMHALDWAIDFAHAGTVIDCVSVWDVTPIVVGSDQFFFPEASDLARDRFDHLVDQVEREAAERHPGADLARVQRHFVDGRPRTELAHAAEGADLLVMGGRGHGAIGAAILGSVSTWLLHEVNRPMVVVPHHVDDASRSPDA